MTQLAQLKLVFYGAGSMAEAIARGMIQEKLTAPAQIAMINRQNQQRLEQLTSQYGVTIPTNEEDKSRLLSEADVIFLAMKPKDAAQALSALSSFLRPSQLIVSVIAGLSVSTMNRILGKEAAIVRTMPNTSSTIGLGATGISYSSLVSAEQRQMTEQMFQSVGLTTVVDESLLGAVTGVSGSGPAYIYYVMEAMIAAGQAQGLTAEAAKQLTVQTVLGAARMVETTGEEPADLRRKVTSPGGTTQAALEVMQERQLAETFGAAIARCVQRAGELGSMLEKEQ
ncbi:pyrroline-5-carboxylate reductase [Paenibacillaceae bacterium]|nr:pyrroline-5-carboxylate reductase [Paenibacillaceae bacterium]